MAIGGQFYPKNPKKYAGNPTNIMFRSTWELRVMQMFDVNPTILKWASEEVKIPYISPLDNLVHHYYPDFIIVYQDRNGKIQKEILEVKPLSESLQHKAKSDQDKIRLLVNDAKWKFASQWAHARGMNFRVITEKSIFFQGTEKKKMAKTAKPTTTTRKTTKTRPTK